MTQFNIDQYTDQPDRIFVELDRRFDVVIVRTATGLELLVYPRTDGELWDFPFASFIVDEQEVIQMEGQMAG